MPDFNQISEKLLVGACPRDRSDIEQLKSIQVGHVICLQSDRDFLAIGIDWPQMVADYKQQNIQLTRVAMTDFDEDNIASVLNKAATTVSQATQSSNKVYLHCSAGRERAPTVAAAWLMREQKLSAEEAYAKVTAARPSNPYLFMLKSLEQTL